VKGGPYLHPATPPSEALAVRGGRQSSGTARPLHAADMGRDRPEHNPISTPLKRRPPHGLVAGLIHADRAVDVPLFSLSLLTFQQLNTYKNGYYSTRLAAVELRSLVISRQRQPLDCNLSKWKLRQTSGRCTWT
jgi:hypothetical protein